MESFFSVYLMEIKRVFSKMTLYLFIFFTLISLYFVTNGMMNYRSIIDQKESFQTIEQIKVKQYINYGQYSAYGFRVLFIPSPLSIFFVNSSTIQELTSNVDAGERLNIYNSFKGKTLFTEKAGGFKDFSGIFLLLGSLLVLYMGYESMIHKDYSRFMTGFIDHRSLYLASILSRLTVVFLLFILNGLLALAIIRLNGFHLSTGEYGYFFLYLAVVLILQIFFFMLGTIAGSLRSRFSGFLMVITSWFLFVFLMPGIISSITSNKADTITSNYRLELEKLKTIMGFEKQALKKVGLTNRENFDEVRQLVESYWRNEYRSIQELEEHLEEDMQNHIQLYETLSLLIPSTFYLSASNEISSKGYLNFIRFYQHMNKLKKDFVRFCIDNRYYAPPTYKGRNTSLRIKPFIKGDGNIFHAKSRPPVHLVAGFIVTLFYIILLTVASYYRFKVSLQL